MADQATIDSLNIIIVDMQILAQAIYDALQDDPATSADESKIGLRESVEIGKCCWELGQDILAVFTSNRAHIADYVEALKHARLVVSEPEAPTLDTPTSAPPAPPASGA